MKPNGISERRLAGPVQLDDPSLAGRMPHQCLIRLKGVFATLRSAEHRAADYLVTQPDEIARCNVADVARRAGCSQATVVRFARKLGYAGFPELRADFRNLDPGLVHDGGPENKALDTRGVVSKIFDASIVALKDTRQLLDPEAYERAVEAFVRAERLAFIGIGNAAVVAHDAYLKFLRIGVTCFQSADPDLQLVLARSQLRKGDVLLAVSYSGASKPLLHAVKQARQTGAVVILITNFPQAPLTRWADIVLLTAVFQKHVSQEVAAKRIAQLCIVESLYANYLIRKGVAAQRKLEESNAALILNKIQ